ncbi:MAG: 30S ribosomal protein S1 [Deltaproteobacteria bacterium]|nr:30S ribosomal protein S1 [Deltaproteobacteria bacterium]
MADNLSSKVDTEISTGANSEQFYGGTIKEPQAGELIKGKVLCIAKDVVIIDIGYKSEGHIPLKEFLDANGSPEVKVGDEIEALMENTDDEKGYVLLSKDKAKQTRVWNDIEEAYKTGKAIEGKIVQKIKAGFSVDLKGIIAFLPGSQADIWPVNNPDQLINNTFMFKVLQYDRRKPNIVVSRRAILEEERENSKQDTVQALEEGKVVDGIVKNITNYGVFVDLGGIDGLLHITDISWGKTKHPSQIFKIGDKISAKVIKFNKEENKVSLGVKQMKPNPWDTAAEKYKVGIRVTGKVISIVDYGAFVELEEGIEGLIHLSELSWIKIKHPSQKLKVGDAVEANILEIDSGNKKLSLSLKQLKPSPWDEIALKYPQGTRIKGIVKNIADYGIFIGIEEYVDGLVHISEISWKKIKHPAELFQKGQEVEAEVVSIDKDKERLSLSIKRLQKDPWRGVEERYHAGMSINGRITNIANFGAFVELEDGLEGLIHVSELTRGSKKGVNITVGDTVETEVLNVDSEEKKIGLGFKALISRGKKSEEQGVKSAGEETTA